jgi:hypothetical protein
MPDQPEPVIADAAIALAVTAVRTGLRAGGAVVGAARRVTRPVAEALAEDERVRRLAATGARYRRTALRRYQTAVTRFVRASAGAAISETERGVRTQAANADRTVSKWFGRGDH